MKKVIKYLPLFFLILVTSCEKDDTEGVSDTTDYAVFDFKEQVVLAVGDSFTPAAKATENGASLNVGIDSSVDTSKVGIYTVTYSAENSDGFAATVTQTVIVHDPTVEGTDVSGNLQDRNRNERKATISLVEGTSNIFFVTDFAFGGVFPMYFQMDGDVISEVPQVYPFGVTMVELTYDSNNRIFTTKVVPQGFDYSFEYTN